MRKPRLNAEERLAIYQAVVDLNRAFTTVVRSSAQLQRAGILGREFTNRYRIRAEELQAEINHKLTGTLMSIEADEWALLGERARRAEKRRARLNPESPKANAPSAKRARG